MNVKCIEEDSLYEFVIGFVSIKYDDIIEKVKDSTRIEEAISSVYNEYISGNEIEPEHKDIATLLASDNGEYKNRFTDILNEILDDNGIDIALNASTLVNLIFPQSIDEVSSENSDKLALQVNLSSIFKSESKADPNIEERKMYGSLDSIRLRKDVLLNDLIFNNLIIRNGRIVNENDYRVNLYAAKLALVRNIVEASIGTSYYGVDISKNDSWFSTYNEESILEYIDDMLNVLNDNTKTITEKSEYMLKNAKKMDLKYIYEMFNKKYPFIDISTMLAKASSISEDDAKFIKAYNSLFILRNINDIVSEKYKMFDVASFNQDIIAPDYIIMKSNVSNNIKDWSEENVERSAADETNQIVKMIIGSNYKYKHADKTKTDMKLSMSSVNTSIGFLNSAINYIDSDDYVIGDYYSEHNILDMLSNMLKNSGEGFKNVMKYMFDNIEVTNRKTNETKSYNGLIDYLISKYNISNENAFGTEISNSIKDGLYSIQMALFQDGGLYDACRECNINPRIRNYYNYIIQYFQGVNRNDFIKITYNDKTDSLEFGNMSMNNINLAKRNVETLINISKNAIVTNMTAYENISNNDDNKFEYYVEKINLENRPNNKNSDVKMTAVAVFKNIDILGDKVNVLFDYSIGIPLVLSESEINNYGKKTSIEIKNMIETNSVVNYIGSKINNLKNKNENVSEASIMRFRKHMEIVFHQPFANNDKLYEEYKNQYNFNIGMDYSGMYKNTYNSIFNIMSMAALNTEIRNNKDKDVDKKKKIKITSSNDLSKFTLNALANNSSGNDTITKADKNSLGYMVITSNDDNVISKIVNSVVSIDDMASRDTVKNKNNDQLPIGGLKRFLGFEGYQLRRIRRDENSAMNENPVVLNTSELVEIVNQKGSEGLKRAISKYNNRKNIYLGTQIIRESDISKDVKNHSAFNLNECFISDFLLGYLDFLDNPNSNYVPFTSTVNADKSTNHMVKFSKSFIEFLSGLDESLMNEFINITLGNMYRKRYENITGDFDVLSRHLSSVISVMSDDDIESYKNMDKITLWDYKTLKALKDSYNEYISNPVNLGKPLPLSKNDYDSNFSSFNGVLKLMEGKGWNNSSPAHVMTLITKLNNLYGGKEANVTLMDMTHYVSYKGEFAIHNNPILVGRLARYAGGEYDNIITSFDDSHESIVSNYKNPEFLERMDDMFMFYAIKNDVEIRAKNDFDKNIKIKSLIRRVSDQQNPFYDEIGASYMIVNIDNKTIKVRNLQDFRYLLSYMMRRDGVNNADDIKAMVDNITSDSKSFIQAIEKMKEGGATIVKNNELMRFNKIHFLTSMMYQEATIGGSYNHPIKGIQKNLFVAESQAVGSVNKRNVSYTTSMHPFMTKSLDGIDDVLEIACIDDINDEVSNYFGSTNKLNAHDGMTVVSPTSIILMNNSLYGDEASYVIKPFIHEHDNHTGSGRIIKTAGFGLTNNTMKMFQNGDILAYKTMGAKWNAPGIDISALDIFKDFNSRYFTPMNGRVNMFDFIKSKYGGLYEKKENGVIHEIVSIRKSGNDPFKYIKVTRNVSTGIESNPEEIIINSNYSLWKALGGMYSMSFNDKTNKYKYSETSLFALVDIMNANMVAVDNDGKYIVPSFNDAKDISMQDDNHIQFMKKGNPDMVVTAGAIKQGMSNVNRHEDFFFNKKGMLSTFKIRADYAGINLDASHKAENSTNSELTQVVSALCANGFTKEVANEAYKALAYLASSPMKSYIKKIVTDIKMMEGKESIAYVNGDEDTYINDIAANIIIRTMVEKQSFTDEMREDCKDLMKRVENGGSIRYSELTEVISVSNPSFMNMAFPAITSFINKNSIKKEFSGTLSVMNPSKGMVFLFGNKKMGQLGVSNDEKIDNLIKIQGRMNEDVINKDNIVKILVGHRYTVYNKDGNKIKEFYLESYKSYKELVDTLRNKDNEGYYATETVIEEIPYDEDVILDRKDGVIITSEKSGRRYIAKGRDLAPMNMYVLNENGEGFNMYDMKSVSDLFSVEILDTLSKDEIERVLEECKVRVGNLDFKPRDIFDSIMFISVNHGSEDGQIFFSPVNSLNQKYDEINKYVVGFKDMIGYHIDKVMKAKKLNESFRNELIRRASSLMDIVRQSKKVDDEILSKLKRGIVTPSSSIELSDGRIFSLDKNAKFYTKRYEAAAPNINRGKFGIDDDMEISDITPKFFLENMVRERFSMISDEKFDYALVKSSGRHIYIYDSRVAHKEIYNHVSPLSEYDEGIEFIDGKMCRVNPDSKEVIYEIPDGAKIYSVAQNGVYNDVIVTDKPSELIKSTSFYDVVISSNLFNEEITPVENTRYQILNMFEESSSKYIEDEKRLEESGRSSKYILEVEDYIDSNKTKIEASIDYAIEKSRQKRNPSTNQNDNYAYDSVLKMINTISNNDILNGDKVSTNPYIDKLAGIAREMYNSFKMSLVFLASRVPSQTQQSFMTMDNVMFENSGLNNTYVNSMQQWLQGSDYDIDKVTLQSYFIDSSGKFIGWSNLFDLSDMETSLRIPLSTGKDSEIRDDQYYSGANNDYVKDLKSRCFKMNKNNKVVIADFTLIPEYLKIVNEMGYIQTFDDDIKGINDGIKKIVDSHNHSLDRITMRNIKAVKNYFTQMSVNISEDPLNLSQSQSSVDDNADISEASKMDKTAAVRLNESYGNYITFVMGFIDNMVGKDGIALVASGLKNFYSTEQKYNMYSPVQEEADVSYKNSKNIKNIVLGRNGNGVTINGKTYYFVANYNPSNKVKRMLSNLLSSSNNSDDIKMYSKILEELTFMFLKKDTALSFSGLMTEAVDNAKNLNLSKINASDDIIPLYSFGLMIGMDFKDIVNIMISNTARIVSGISKGNVFFNGGEDLSFSNIYNTIYSWNGGYYSGDFQKFSPIFNVMINPENAGSIETTITSMLNGNKSNIYSRAKFRNDESLIRQFSGDNSLQLYFRYFNTRFRFIKGINDVITVNGTERRITIDEYIENFKNDMILAASGVNVKADELINWINRMSKMIRYNYELNNDFTSDQDKSKSTYIDEMYKLNKGVGEVNESAIAIGLNKGIKQTRPKLTSFNERVKNMISLDQRKEINLINEDFSDTLISNKRIGNLNGFNYELYLNNEEYKSAVDERVDKAKFAINPIDIAVNVPHLREYLNVYNMTNKILEAGISKKVKAINDFAGEMILRLFGDINVGEAIKSSISKNAAIFVESIAFNSFIRNVNINNQKGFSFIVPPGFDYYMNGKIVKSKNTRSFEMVLGTDDANSTFLKLMNEVVIPELKEGYTTMNDPENRRLFVSDFIKDLGPINYDSKLTGVSVDTYTLGINAMSNNEYDLARMNFYKTMADRLKNMFYSFGVPNKGKNAIKHRISDLMYVYNMLTFMSDQNKYSLERYFTASNTPIMEMYEKFSDNFEYEYALPNLEKIKNTSYFKIIAAMLSPVVGPNTELTYVKMKDYDDMEVKMYEKTDNFVDERPRRTSYQSDEGIDENQEENESYNDYYIPDSDDSGMDESMYEGETYSSASKSKYNFEEIGKSINTLYPSGMSRMTVSGNTYYLNVDGVVYSIKEDDFVPGLIIEESKNKYSIYDEKIKKEITKDLENIKKRLNEMNDDSEGISEDGRRRRMVDIYDTSRSIISKILNYEYQNKNCK